MASKSPQPSSAKRVGIWIRVSTEDQARGESPEHHELRARHYAESRGWTVVEVYHLEGVSGKTVIEHAEAKRMLKDVERGHISGLIFSKLARLGRNTRELLDFAEYFDKHHADLISLQESIDTSTPAGRLFYTMIAAMANWEREEIASRVTASIPIRAKLGKPLGGQAPYGYRWKDKKLAVHPDEAPVRKLAYELFAKHQRRTTVAKMLNEMGYRARQGRPFQRMTVEYMIQDPTAKGVHRGNYSKRVGSTKGWDFKPEEEWVFTECEAIVSEELWDRCNAILAQQKAKAAPPPKRAVQLFGGLTWCGLCGDKMYVKSNTPKYVCRGCNNKIAAVDLEDIFVEQLKEYLLSPTEIARYLEQANQTIRDKTELLTVLKKEQASVQQEMDHIFKLYMERKITTDEFGERHGPCEQRKAQLKDEVPALEAEIDFLRVNLLSSDEILSQARDLYGRWSELTIEDKHRVVQSIVERITIGTDEIEIQLFYLPTHDDPRHDPPADPSRGPKNGSARGSSKYSTPKKSMPPAFPEKLAKGASDGCGRWPAGSPGRRSRAPRRGWRWSGRDPRSSSCRWRARS